MRPPSEARERDDLMFTLSHAKTAAKRERVAAKKVPHLAGCPHWLMRAWQHADREQKRRDITDHQQKLSRLQQAADKAAELAATEKMVAASAAAVLVIH